MEKQNIVIKRISVEVPEDFLQRLKLRAVRRNVTLKRYITGALLHFLQKEEDYDR